MNYVTSVIFFSIHIFCIDHTLCLLLDDMGTDNFSYEMVSFKHFV